MTQIELSDGIVTLKSPASGTRLDYIRFLADHHGYTARKFSEVKERGYSLGQWIESVEIFE